MKLSEQMVKDRTETSLIDAITQDHFVLYGQRIVPLNPGQDRVGYIEVLIRYMEEERNLLPPGGFFEVLESLRLMAVLDRWVLNRVMRSLVSQYAAQKNWDGSRYSVNLSVDSLYEDEFCGLVIEYFRKNNLPAGKLWFEICESDAQSHGAALQKLMATLIPVGCGFTITSYSGGLITLSSLRMLGVDSVKIDGQIIGGLNGNGAASAKAKAIQLVCADLRIRTIVESVESPETLEAARKRGFNYAQGFAIEPPVPLHSLTMGLN